MLLIIIRGVLDESQIQHEPEWYIKLLDHGLAVFIVSTMTLFMVGMGWSLKGKLGGLLVSWKNQSDTMTKELPAIRKGVERLVEESAVTLRSVHEDVQYIKGAVGRPHQT